MNPDIRLIALDLDGTLLGADHDTIPQRNLDALRAAAGRGVKLAIASGRSWSLIRETAEQLGPVAYGITANGAFTLDAATREPMVALPLDKGQTAAIIRVLRRWKLSYELYLGPDNFVERSDLDGLAQFSFSDSFQEMYLRNMTVTDDMLEALKTGEPEKFDIFYVPPEDRAAVIRDLEATGPLTFSGGFSDNLELTAPQVHKGAALSGLAAKLGLTAEQVMAFGDADNDLEMLSWASWSFAMANAVPEVKAVARYQTGPNHEGGVGMAVEQYILSQRP